jgi:hypothetical protein
MNYRAFNLLTDQPNSTSVPEPEAAGAIAWILHQAYIQTKNTKYLQGAELSLDFLQNWTTNPSYEIQLPYGIAAAARMNAEEGSNYDIEKFMNWAFSGGQGTLRGWGTIVGKWGDYDVSGLIGEANDKNNDYAFVMNGFQHAAALAPVAKYDKRFARAIGKWILNLANASRLFYTDMLPQANQQTESYNWSNQYDSKSCIPFESMKQNWQGKIPFAMGDAFRNNWAATDLSLYSGSSVGYMAALIQKTNIEGILQIDLNKTDFRGENTYPVYLYYNPTTQSQQVKISLQQANVDIYDAITEKVLMTNQTGEATITIPSDGVRLVVIYPTGKSLQTSGRVRKVYNGGIIDYHYGYNYTNSLRIKSFSADKTSVAALDKINFNCLVENNMTTPTYIWEINGVTQSGASSANLEWTAPEQSGIYRVSCSVTADYKTVKSSEIEVLVAPKGLTIPSITSLSVQGNSPFNINDQIHITAVAPLTEFDNITWISSDGSFTGSSTLTPTWTAPALSGMYSITLTVSNVLGEVGKTVYILVKDKNDISSDFYPKIYYPFNGDTKNYANSGYDDAVSVNASLTGDAQGSQNSAYKFTSSDTYIYTVNSDKLNFTDKIALSFWIKPDKLPSTEQFIISHGSWEERYKVSITPEKKVRWTLKTSEKVADIDDPAVLNVNDFVHYTDRKSVV